MSTPAATTPVLLAVDGRSGAGKSSLAGQLVDRLRGEHADVELFHVEDAYRGWHGLATGLEDYADHVLHPLGNGLPARWHPWDWEQNRSSDRERITRPASVVVCEGVGAGCPAARPHLTATLTLTAPSAERKRRALARDGETYRPYWDVWAAQEDLLARVPDAEGDLTLDVTDGVDRHVGRALAWARAAIATAAITAERS